MPSDLYLIPPHHSCVLITALLPSSVLPKNRQIWQNLTGVQRARCYYYWPFSPAEVCKKGRPSFFLDSEIAKKDSDFVGQGAEHQ